MNSSPWLPSSLKSHNIFAQWSTLHNTRDEIYTRLCVAFFCFDHSLCHSGAILNSPSIRAPFQYPIRSLIVRSREVSKPRDLYLELFDCSEIWQAPRQCQISKRCGNLNYQSRSFETSRDLTIRRLIGYWNGAKKVAPDGYGWNRSVPNHSRP